MSRVTGVCVCDAQILASGCEHTVVVYMHPLEFSKTSNTGCLLQILGIVFRCVAVCCSVWMVCFNVLQCVAVCCSVLQCFVTCCSVSKTSNTGCLLQMLDVVLQYVAVCCNVLQCF